MSFTSPLHHNDTIETDGFTLTVTCEGDGDHGAPWDEEDGHGPVTCWERRDKKPGEMVLASDNGRSLFYDYAATCRIALRDGWDTEPFNTDKSLSPKQQAARAALADFNRLRRYCDGQWSYVGVIVTASREGVELATASLWGIESDAGDYLTETANDLASDAVSEARETISRLTVNA